MQVTLKEARRYEKLITKAVCLPELPKNLLEESESLALLEELFNLVEARRVLRSLIVEASRATGINEVASEYNCLKHKLDILRKLSRISSITQTLLYIKKIRSLEMQIDKLKDKADEINLLTKIELPENVVRAINSLLV